MRTALSLGPRSDRAAPYRCALRSRTFRLMVTAHGVGTVGQLMLTLAVGIEVLDRTGSGGWLSVTMALGFVPYVLTSGYAGMLADRHSRSAVLTWSLWVRAGCATALAVGLPLVWPVPALVAITAAAAFTATPALAAGVLMTARTRDEGYRGRHAAARRRRTRWAARAQASRPSPMRPMEHRPDSGGPLRRRPAVRIRP